MKEWWKAAKTWLKRCSLVWFVFTCWYLLFQLLLKQRCATPLMPYCSHFCRREINCQYAHLYLNLYWWSFNQSHFSTKASSPFTNHFSRIWKIEAAKKLVYNLIQFANHHYYKLGSLAFIISGKKEPIRNVVTNIVNGSGTWYVISFLRDISRSLQSVDFYDDFLGYIKGIVEICVLKEGCKYWLHGQNFSKGML